jgi:hypothetical protein
VRPHTSIGVLGAVSVVTALAIPGAVGSELAVPPAGVRYGVEHATGQLEVEADIDTSGPIPRVRRCGVFLYVYEPGGNRIELCNPVARLIFAPDWPVITWTEAERAKGQAWGLRRSSRSHARHPARGMMATSLPPAPGRAHPPPVIHSTR